MFQRKDGTTKRRRGWRDREGHSDNRRRERIQMLDGSRSFGGEANGGRPPLKKANSMPTPRRARASAGADLGCCARAAGAAAPAGRLLQNITCLQTCLRPVPC